MKEDLRNSLFPSSFLILLPWTCACGSRPPGVWHRQPKRRDRGVGKRYSNVVSNSTDRASKVCARWGGDIIVTQSGSDMLTLKVFWRGWSVLWQKRYTTVCPGRRPLWQRQRSPSPALPEWNNETIPQPSMRRHRWL